MSRTNAHVPASVEVARLVDKTILDTTHRHWVPGRGLVSCLDPDARCYQYVPRWASSQTGTRRGTAQFERRAGVRDVLKDAAKEYRATGQVSDLVMPDPTTYCLCQMCGVR